MNLRILSFVSALLLTVISLPGFGKFIAFPEEMEPYYHRHGVILVASPGRSASTMLAAQVRTFAPKYELIKAHHLPPDSRYKGKILFIFSNPDKAAESALHVMLDNPYFGNRHFVHLDSADRKWLKNIKNARHQTLAHNLLSYDALGCHKQLRQWLHTETQEATAENAQILAVKYENLWEPQTIEAIRKFLKIERFELPPKRTRGYSEEGLKAKELEFRRAYNVGSPSEPRYVAYDEARQLWRQAPAIQYRRLGKASTSH